MKFILFYLLLFILCPGIAFSQEEDKMLLQQQLLLSKDKQVAVAKQQAEKLQFEKQEKQLAEQEKQLLELRVIQKEAQLHKEKSKAQVISIQSRYLTAIKDKRILQQETNIRQSRRWIYYLISISLLIFAVTVFIYFSQRKTRRLNEQITTQHEELQQVSDVKDRLLTIVGHDMRSPLNMLLGLSQILQHEKIPKAKMEAYMSQLESTLNHTSSMMDNLLHWAASQMQGYRPHIQGVNAAEIVSDVLLLQEGRAEDKGISLQNKVAPGFMVQCDPDMLTLVIRNLVSNAVKFSSTGGEIIVCSSEDGNAIISVIDNGVGMNPVLLHQFNSNGLSGIESTRGTDKEKGTGLGLLLCKTFTRLMNGHMLASPNPEGKGTIFNIILPHA